MRKRMVSLAVALLACAAPAAFGGSMSATPVAIDLTTAPDIIVLPDISITFGNNLMYQDDLSISVEGAEAVFPGFPMNIPCDGQSGSVFGYVTTTQAAWLYRVTIPGELAYGTTCTFQALKIRKSSLAENCSVSVRYVATRFFNGSTLDSGGPVSVATCVKPTVVKDPPGLREGDRYIQAYYSDGVTEIVAFMQVTLIESIGYESRFAFVSKYDVASGESFDCYADQNVSVAVSQSGRAEGRATVTGDFCPAPGAPLSVTCQQSNATLATVSSSNVMTRGGRAGGPEKWQTRDWRFEPLRCSIVAFGAEYQTDTATARVMRFITVP